MDQPHRTARPPLFPHKDMFSGETEDLVDTGIELFDLDDDRRPIALRMYLGMGTVDQVAGCYGKTLRSLVDLERAQAAVDWLADSDLLQTLIDENRELRRAVIAVCSRRGLTVQGMNALTTVLGRDTTPEQMAFLGTLKKFGD